MSLTAQTLKILGRRPPARAAAAQEAARALVRTGMPVSVVDRLAKHFGTSVETIQRIIGVSRATGTRKRTQRAPLRALASDRAFRLAGVYALAEQALEDPENARAWFKEPNRALRGETPLSLLDTEAGTQEVIRTLQRLEHGVYS